MHAKPVGQLQPKLNRMRVAINTQSTRHSAIAAFFVVLLAPPELVIRIAEVSVSPARLLLLIFLPIAFTRIVQDPSFRIKFFDLAIIAAVLWLWCAISINYEPNKAATLGGSLAVEALGSYTLARVYIRNLADFTFAVKAYVAAIAFAAALALLDIVTGTFIAHELASGLMGVSVPNYVQISYAPSNLRLGLLRPFSVFDHPIHYGIFCATAFGLLYFSFYRKRLFWPSLALVTIGATLSLSSGAYLGLAFGLAFCIWELVTRHLPHRFFLSALCISLVIAAGMLLSNRSLIEVLISMTLDPGSGYYRLYIWEYGSAAIASSPLFGIALENWQKAHFMSTSIDNFWLLMAMQGGIPVIAALALSLAVLFSNVHRRGAAIRSHYAARLGWSSAMVAMVVQGMTVHYWGQLFMFFFFLIGMGGWITDARGSSAVQDNPSADRPLPRKLVYRNAPKLVHRTPPALVRRRPPKLVHKSSTQTSQLKSS